MSAIIQSNKDFEVFFRENFPPVYAFMKRYTGDDELAADLAQETFIRVYERRDEIVSVDYGRAFLYTIARHLYWNHCKHQRAKENYFTQLDENNVDDYDFLQEVTRQETMRMLYVSIDQLPPQTRNVILLNLEGKTNPEVAEELGITVNTVKTHITRALKFLRDELQEDLIMLLLCLKRI